MELHNQTQIITIYFLTVPYQTRNDKDVAFALSYGEAASFISDTHMARDTGGRTKSPNVAITNYGKLPLLNANAIIGMWLRTEGDYSTFNCACPTACSLRVTNACNEAGYVYHFYLSYSGPDYTFNQRGLVYPALWVDSAIFETPPTDYDVSYVLNGGVNAPSNPNTYSVASLPLNIAHPSKSGYTFSHWTLTCANGTVITLPSTGIPAGTTGNVVLTAVWGAPIQYAVSYNLNGGTPSMSYPSTYNIETCNSVNNISLVAPVMTGYRFVTWRAFFDNGTFVDLSSGGLPVGTTGDVRLAAIWDPTPVYFTITYVLDGGVNGAGNPFGYTVASTFPVSIGNPTKSGHTFLGWIVVYSNGTFVPLVSSYSIPAGSAGDVTLSAFWLAVSQPSYNIDYVLGGGSFSSMVPSVYAASDLPLSIPIPSRVGFVFSHWIVRYADGSESVLSGGVVPVGTVGDVTLIAVWSAIPLYSISYALNGGVNGAGNPASYSGGDAFPIGLVDPSLSGYTFLYWIMLNENGSLSMLPPSGIPAGTTGNIVLIAVWYP
jgi:uncharacterized repeat protein (TIGR02543 family)